MHKTKKHDGFRTIYWIIVCALFSLPNIIFADSVNHSLTGKWLTIDDASGEPKSVIEITVVDTLLQGTIIELINPSTPNPLCTKCTGDKANQPIQGMTIMWGLTQHDNSASGGTILDPKKGKIYKAKISLKGDGTQLKVRGYIGTPMLGRTQVWQRVKQ